MIPSTPTREYRGPWTIWLCACGTVGTRSGPCTSHPFPLRAMGPERVPVKVVPVHREPTRDECACGHEESDGRTDVLRCPVHGQQTTDAASSSETEAVRLLREASHALIERVEELAVNGGLPAWFHPRGPGMAPHESLAGVADAVSRIRQALARLDKLNNQSDGRLDEYME